MNCSAQLPWSRSGTECVVIRSPVRTSCTASPGRGDQADRFDTEGHRRPGPGVPVAGADELVPVAHAARVDLDQYLVRAQRARAGQLKQLHRVSGRRIPAAYMATLRAQSGFLAVTLIRRPAPRRRRLYRPCSSPWASTHAADR